jgi:FkbM family methyltransferase
MKEDFFITLNSITGTFNMVLKRPGLVEDGIYQLGSWEPHLAKMLSNNMKEGSIFLDIGAYIGYHSLYMASISPKITCISFEPHPMIYKQFIKNADINQMDNIVVHNLAVGDFNGRIHFYMQNDSCYNQALSSIEPYEGIDDNFEKVDINMVTLDKFIDDKIKRRVSAIKIDTQGYEYQVIHGALDIIHASRPVIAFEYHTHSERSLKEILNLIPDYDVYKIQPFTGEIRSLADADPANFLNDFICIPKNKS